MTKPNFASRLPVSPAGRANPHKRLSAVTVTGFTRELAELLLAGLPLLSALDLLADSGVGRREDLLRAIHDRIAQGQPLSATLRHYPTHFDALYLRVVALGEASGQLAEMLMHIADDRERQAEHRAQLLQALIYPAFVCTVALGVVLALMLWAVPAFEQLFDNFGAPLPTLTLVVLWLSRRLVDHGPVLAMLSVFVGVAISIAIRRSTHVHRACARAVRRLPVVGALLQQMAVARWTSALAALLAAGMPLVDALMSIAENHHRGDRRRIVGADPAQRHSGGLGFEQVSEALAQRLRAGDRFAAAVRHVGDFPAIVVRTIEIAEHTASLERMLADLGRRTTIDAQRRLRRLMQWIEPAVITLAGAFIAVLVLSLYLPIIKLGDVV